MPVAPKMTTFIAADFRISRPDWPIRRRQETSTRSHAQVIDARWARASGAGPLYQDLSGSGTVTSDASLVHESPLRKANLKVSSGRSRNEGSVCLLLCDSRRALGRNVRGPQALLLR